MEQNKGERPPVATIKAFKYVMSDSRRKEFGEARLGKLKGKLEKKEGIDPFFVWDIFAGILRVLLILATFVFFIVSLISTVLYAFKGDPSWMGAFIGMVGSFFILDCIRNSI